jgi:hypothetical protein
VSAFYRLNYLGLDIPVGASGRNETPHQREADLFSPFPLQITEVMCCSQE